MKVHELLVLAGALAVGAEWARAADSSPAAGLQPVAEEVVVTANLTPTDLETVGSSVTVIGPEEIAARNKTSVLELLRSVPGLAAVAAGGPGRASSVFIRGANSSHTLVLVDGVRVNSAGTGEYDFADLRAEQIERIEIVRGPQSSLYGSEAIGGVINIVTRRGAAGQRWSAAAEAGNKGAERVRAAAEGGAEAGDYSVSVAQERAPGFSLASEAAGNDRLDPYRNASGALLVGARVGAEGRAELSVRGWDATVHPDGYAFDYASGELRVVPAPNFTQERTGVLTGLKIDLPTTAAWRQTLRASFDTDCLRGTDPDAAENNFGIRSKAASGAWQSDFTLSTADRLTVGLAYERRRGAVEGGYDETAAIRSVFAENQWSWRERVYVTGAARRDDHTVFGAANTYRVTGAVRWPEHRARLHASWGTGFKAPTFFDLFFPGYSNRDLRPETSEGYDLGVGAESANRRVRADVTLFRNNIRDLIDFSFDTFRPENIGRARTRGAELTFSAVLGPELQIGANYTYTAAEDLRTGQPLPRRPTHQAALTAGGNFSPAFSGLVTLLLFKDRVDSDGRRLDDITRVDLNAQRRIGRGVSVYARVENVFDQRVEEIRGYRSPGRVGAVGLDVAF